MTYWSDTDSTDVYVYYTLGLGWKGYKGEPLYSVANFTCKKANDFELLDWIYRQMNVVDGNEMPRKLGIRSMSVGDVVQISDRFYSCDNTGWSLLEIADVNIIGGMAGTRTQYRKDLEKLLDERI